MNAYVHEETIDGFTIRFYPLVEYTHPRDSFDDSCCDIADICDKIDRGIYEWFCAKVTASKAGIKLAEDYLGCCLYDSFKEFLNDPYFSDMKDRVITEAKQKICELAEA
jgi:hypothetical protein